MALCKPNTAQLHEQIDFNGASCIMIKGLWLVTDSMGILSTSWVYDEQHNRMVYRTDMSMHRICKRPLVRQLSYSHQL